MWCRVISPSFLFLQLYFLLNSSDGNDAKWSMFSAVDCWRLSKDQLCRAVAPTAFSIDHSFVNDVLWYTSPCVNKALLQVAGVVEGCLVHVFLYPQNPKLSTGLGIISFQFIQTFEKNFRDTVYTYQFWSKTFLQWRQQTKRVICIESTAV